MSNVMYYLYNISNSYNLYKTLENNKIDNILHATHKQMNNKIMTKNITSSLRIKFFFKCDIKKFKLIRI